MRQISPSPLPQKEDGMVEWISEWAGAIIVAVIIGTIIEMILPEGNSKKYIKVVIGIYVLFTIVSPIITKFTGKEIEVSDALELDTYVEEAKKAAETHNIIESENSDNIMSIYKSGIKSDMTAKIEAKGYKINSIEIEIANDDSYSVLSINADIEKIDETNSDSDNINSKSNNIVQVNDVEKVNVYVSSNNRQ